MFSIKKKAQKLDPLMISSIPKTQASYQKLMLEMMSKLVTQTKKNNTLISQHFAKPSSPKSQISFLRDATNNNSPNKKKVGEIYEHFPVFSPKSKQNTIIVEVDQSHSGNNLIPKSLKGSASTQQFQKSSLASVGQEVKPDGKTEKQSKIEKILENLQKRLKTSQQINLKLLQKIESLQTVQTPQPPPPKQRKSVQQQQIELINKLIKNPHSDQHDKNSYNILSQILPHSDRRQMKIKFRLSDILNKNGIQSPKNVKSQTAQWLGMVYRATASICWNMLLNNYLSFDEVKILFTENIVFNFITLMNQLKDLGFQSHRQQLTNLINEKSVDILDFLCKQYPQTKIEAPNMALRAILTPIQNSGKIKYDLVSKSNVKLTYENNSDYTQQIMRIINYMIKQSNEEYQQFYDSIKGIFEQIFYTNDNRVKKMAQRTQNDQDLTYRTKVKSYTKYLIGRKISKNTTLYTDEEIEDGVFFVRSSGVLRIITKWVEQLMDYINQPEAKIKKSYNENKDHSGNSMYISSFIKNILYQQVIDGKKILQDKIQAIKKECYKMELLLTMEEFTTDNTQLHLSQQQINVGMFCSNLKSAISAYICAQLNEIIHFLLEIPKKADLDKYMPKDLPSTESVTFKAQAKKDLQSVNLVTFKIFDLLRCKIHSNEEQIIWIVNEMLHKNLNNQETFNIVRIKDRLHLGTRDIMINAQVNKGLVCEIQLAVTSQSDKKQELLDSYNHFLYELKRSKLGPLTENVSIWSTLEQRFSHFESLLRKKMKQSIKKQPRKHKCGLSSFKSFKRPIICGCCKNFFAIPKTCLLNVRCQLTQQTFCGQCYYYNYLSKDERKLYIFDQKKLIKGDAMQKLIEYTDFSSPLPATGFFIKKGFLKKELSFYMALEKTKSETDITELLIVQTVIRGDKIFNRQLNQSQIQAKIDNKNFIIKKYDKTELNNFIIFYFDNKFKAKNTIPELQALLKTPEYKNTKILNVLKQPCYINNLKPLKKQSDKFKELQSLKKVVENQKIVYYIFESKSVIILAQVLVTGSKLRSQATKKLNLGELKKFVRKESDIINMQNKALTTQFEELPLKINDNRIFDKFSQNLKKLFLSNGNIETMKDFSVFKNVEFIVISDNKLKSLDGIQTLQKLAYFRFDGNQITSLEPLESIISLKSIYGNKNKITSLKGLEAQKDLKILSLYNNQIQSVKQLQNSTHLQQLYLKDNPITDLSPISQLINLNKLFLGGNKASVLPNLKEMKSLKYLSLQNLNLVQIPEFSQNVKLLELHLDSNKIKSINTNLNGQTYLNQLNLSNNQILTIQNLRELSSLQVLNLANNKITVVSGLNNCDSLKFVDLRTNEIDDIEQMLKFQVTFQCEFSEDLLSEKAKLQKIQMQNHSKAQSQSDQ